MIYRLYATPDQFDDLMLSGEEVLSELRFIAQGSKLSFYNDPAAFGDAVKWLDLYFSGDIPDFIPEFKVDYKSDFQKDVLDIVSKIPYGETRTYKEIALLVAKKRNSAPCAQAAGRALKDNPLCLLIPCHRVIGKNGDLTGYNGGINNKRELLKIEGSDIRQNSRVK